MRKYLAIILIIISSIFTISCSLDVFHEKIENDKNVINYTSAFGDVFVPIDPQVIVTDTYLGELLALDANVVGANLDEISIAWEGRLEGIENIQSDITRIESLSPDLIIISNEDLYEECLLIAPTVLIPKGQYNPEMTFLEIGKIVGEKQKATDWLINFNRITNDYRQYVSSVKNLAILDVVDNEPILFGKNSGHGGYLAYKKLGLIGTKSAEQDYLNLVNSFVRVDTRNLNKYIDDCIVILNETGTADGNSDVINELINSEEFKLTKAYRNNSVVYLKSEVFLYTDPLSLDLQILELEKYYKENN